MNECKRESRLFSAQGARGLDRKAQSELRPMQAASNNGLYVSRRQSMCPVSRTAWWQIGYCCAQFPLSLLELASSSVKWELQLLPHRSLVSTKQVTTVSPGILLSLVSSL